MRLCSVIRHAALAAFLLCLGAGQGHAVEATSIRVARLSIKPDRLTAFTEAVEKGMEASLRVEAGVAAIYAAADKHNPADMIFFEMYADEDAYRRHRNTPHFQEYFHTTKDMIADRVLEEAVPVELRDRYNTPAEYTDAPARVAASSIRIARLKIREDRLAAFTEAVKEEMEAALRVEPGVVALYAVADKADPTAMTFFEMYVDENAYRTHRETPHFQKYLHATENMIVDRRLGEYVPVALRDKQNTPSSR